MKLIGYLRVSSKKQGEGFSLEAQKENIKAYCKLYKHDVLGFKEDKGSGAKKNKGLSDLLKIIYKEELDGIIVDKLDRLFRNTEEILKTARELREKGKVIISISEQFDISTPFGQLALTVISGFAEFEKSRIKERIMQGKQNKKEAGGYTGGNLPLGYKSVEKKMKNGKSIKILEQDDKEQKIIEIVNEERKKGKSLDFIAEFLNENGYKTKKKKMFTATQIFRIVNYKPKLVQELCV